MKWLGHGLSFGLWPYELFKLDDISAKVDNIIIG